MYDVGSPKELNSVSLGCGDFGVLLYNKVTYIAFLSIKNDTDEPDVLSGLDVFLWVSSFEYLLNGLFFGLSVLNSQEACEACFHPGFFDECEHR